MWQKCLCAWFRVQGPKKGEHAMGNFHGRPQKIGYPICPWRTQSLALHKECYMSTCVEEESPEWSTPKKQGKSLHGDDSSIQFTAVLVNHLLEVWCWRESGREVMTSLLLGRLCFHPSEKIRKSWEATISVEVLKQVGQWDSGLKPRAFSPIELRDLDKLLLQSSVSIEWDNYGTASTMQDSVK